jgi:hypothetical protein
MNKTTLTLLSLLTLALILALVIFDFLGDRPDKRGGNPYEYNVDQFKTVDPGLVHYRETKNIPLGDRVPGGIDVFGGEIYLSGLNFIIVLRPDGVQKTSFPIEGKGECIKATENNIIVGLKTRVLVYDHSGKLMNSWEIEKERTIITSIAVKDNMLFVADAGNRRVLRYSLQGELQAEFEGKREGNAGHGFIVPSANFDVAVNSFGELWVTNPGEHGIENYTDDGQIRGYWAKSSMEIEGFTGCCNPAEIAVLEDGSFVTSEKGLVRIKVYDASGKLISVVAPPEKFNEEGHAPEVAVGKNGEIYALDFDRNLIRLFEKK